MQEGKFVVLCIDDDQDVLDGLRMVIESNVVTVMEEAHSGQEGLRRFSDLEPDLVMVDLMMESNDAGLKAARAMRKQNAEVPIYMLTSVGDDLATVMDVTAEGLSGVFQKPISPDELTSCIERRLNQLAG